MIIASEKLKTETIKALDALISEFGETLPTNFVNRMQSVSDMYFCHRIDGINMWRELCNIQGFTERNIYPIEEIKTQVTMLRNFIVLSMRK